MLDVVERVLAELRASLAQADGVAAIAAPGDIAGQHSFKAGWLARTVESAIEQLEMVQMLRRNAS